MQCSHVYVNEPHWINEDYPNATFDTISYFFSDMLQTQVLDELTYTCTENIATQHLPLV